MAVPEEVLEKDAGFTASRVPVSARSRALVHEVREQLLAHEKRFHARVRARKRADQERFDRIVAALICDLAHAALATPGQWRHISLSKRQHGSESVGAPFMTAARIEIIEWLSDPMMGWIELEKGESVRNPFGGRQSRVRAAARLRRRIEELEIDFDDFGRDPALMGDPIVMRGPKRRGRTKNLPVPPGEPADTYRHELMRINQWLAGANITSDLPDEKGRFRDAGDRWLRRIFNNGRLDQGGRLYGGFWQGMSESHRLQSITIDEEPVVSLDFCQCAIHIAYAQAGAEPPNGDLYSIPGFEQSREGIKVVMNSLPHRIGPMTRFPRGTRRDFPGYSIRDVLSAIFDYHHPVRHVLQAGQGMAGFFIESQVLVKSLLRLIDLKVVALPVHDCLLVPLPAAEVAREAMQSSFREVTPAVADIEVEGLCASPPCGTTWKELERMPWIKILQEG